MKIEYLTELEKHKTYDLSEFCVGWKKPISSTDLVKILKNSPYIVLAIDKEKEKVIGFVNAISDQVKFAFIPMIEVLPEYQKLEIGTKLMSRILKMLEKFDCVDLICDPPVQYFYQKFQMVKTNGMSIRRY